MRKRKCLGIYYVQNEKKWEEEEEEEEEQGEDDKTLLNVLQVPIEWEKLKM